jgi:hypothetical protein
MSGLKILQIIPADGWEAIFKNDEGTFTEPIVCLALVESMSGARFVEGMIAWPPDDGIVLCEDNKGFIKYQRAGGVKHD